MKRILLENETNTSVTCKQHSAFPSSFSCLSISLTSKLIPDLILFNVFCIFLWHPQKKKLSAFTVDSFSQPSVILGQYFKNTSHFQCLVMAALRRACIHLITYLTILVLEDFNWDILQYIDPPLHFSSSPPLENHSFSFYSCSRNQKPY